jgi:hypothetical protein
VEEIAAAPWEDAGWLRGVEDWVDGQVERTGMLEMVKKWSISVVIKVPTREGRVFFKQSLDLPLFVSEPVVTRELAALFVGHISEVVAVDEQRRWVLLEDFGETLRDQKDEDVICEVLQLFAGMQTELVGREDELLAFGCIDRRLSWLRGQIDALFADEVTRGQLKEGELERLLAQVPLWLEMCDELAALPVPETLLHGDLHLGNVARKRGRYIFFDWTDASVSHPFFDLIIAHNEGDVARKERFLAANIEPWRAWGDEKVLRRAWRISPPLCYLHHALSYWYILRNLPVEKRHELDDGLHFFLQKLLDWTPEI